MGNRPMKRSLKVNSMRALSHRIIGRDLLKVPHFNFLAKCFVFVALFALFITLGLYSAKVFHPGFTMQGADAAEHTVKPRLDVPIGINMSEAEYSWGGFPTEKDLVYLRANRITLIRLPIAWEKAQPVLGGALDQSYIAGLKKFLSTASAQNMQVIVDLHNYGRYNPDWQEIAVGQQKPLGPGQGNVIGSPALPIPAFAQFWKMLAQAIAGTPGLAYYDIMNEPHAMGNPDVWPSAAQAAVNAIRSVDSNTQILVEGDQWASAYKWPRDNGNLHITDPANKLLYEAHLYFDDGSSNYAQSYNDEGAYPNIGADRVKPFLDWLKQNNAKGFLGEFGVPGNDPQWLPVLDKFLTTIQAAGVPGTYWVYLYQLPSNPDWWPDGNPLAITMANGRNNRQLNILSEHNTPEPSAKPASGQAKPAP